MTISFDIYDMSLGKPLISYQLPALRWNLKHDGIIDMSLSVFTFPTK